MIDDVVCWSESLRSPDVLCFEEGLAKGGLDGSFHRQYQMTSHCCCLFLWGSKPNPNPTWGLGQSWFGSLHEEDFARRCLAKLWARGVLSWPDALKTVEEALGLGDDGQWFFSAKQIAIVPDRLWIYSQSMPSIVSLFQAVRSTNNKRLHTSCVVLCSCSWVLCGNPFVSSELYDDCNCHKYPDALPLLMFAGGQSPPSKHARSCESMRKNIGTQAF